MAMSDRQFAAIHDRYLDPPDEEFDDDAEFDDDEEFDDDAEFDDDEEFDDTTDDEMDLASIRKQEQRDREDFEAEHYRRSTK